MTEKCEALTNAGKRCSRDQKQGKLCTQHAKKTGNLTLVTAREPWDVLGIPGPDATILSRHVQQIRTKLKPFLPPFTASDKKDAGSLYIYFLRRERRLQYWKIGRTSRNVDDRLLEWAKEHGQDKQVVKQCEIPVARNHKAAESLVHLFLVHRRMNRTPYRNGFHSTWYMGPNDVIEDGQQQPANSKERLVAKSKHTEWFCCNIDEVMRVVNDVVRIVTK